MFGKICAVLLSCGLLFSSVSLAQQKAADFEFVGSKDVSKGAVLPKPACINEPCEKVVCENEPCEPLIIEKSQTWKEWAKANPWTTGMIVAGAVIVLVGTGSFFYGVITPAMVKAAHLQSPTIMNAIYAHRGGFTERGLHQVKDLDALRAIASAASSEFSSRFAIAWVKMRGL